MATTDRRPIAVRLTKKSIDDLDELGRMWSEQEVNRSEVIRSLVIAALNNPSALAAAKGRYLTRTQPL